MRWFHTQRAAPRLRDATTVARTVFIAGISFETRHLIQLFTRVRNPFTPFIIVHFAKLNVREIASAPLDVQQRKKFSVLCRVTKFARVYRNLFRMNLIAIVE